MPDWGNFFTDYALIVAQAWADDKLRQRLIDHPREVLREHGYPIGDSITVKITEGGAATILDLPFPEKPRDLDARTIEAVVELWDNDPNPCCC